MIILLQNNNLYIQGCGLFIGKKSRRLQITQKNKTLDEYPLIHMRNLILAGNGLGISTDLIQALSTNNIPIICFDNLSRPYAYFSSPSVLHHVRLRRAQLELTDNKRALLTRTIINAKVERQFTLVKQLKIKNREQMEHTERSISTNKLLSQQTIGGTLGIEAHIAALYWQIIASMVPTAYHFHKRVHQHPADLVNKLFNYGYGILYTHIWRLVTLVGFDPFIGIFHKDGRARPALIYDLAESYRPIVDTVVLRYLRKNINKTMNFSQRIKKFLITNIEKELNEITRGTDGKRYKRKDLMEQEFRKIARYCKNETQDLAAIFEPSFMD
ncbi:MAG: CRISPR-associated endonuclease Cas1 [Parcubacteria group bacterium GW2011_GWA2_47_8]|nr:MAG: CRISPR-associated endonuclease Cas1 [Parcubacteria group bacterium GW2011_GWA2_47_8]OHB21236.1 MAG: hypothetical protein A2666_05630 [Parcubacteria group bacterium RIFCSPHIGHO2_01_FULL_47_10b]QBM02298.1 CRISPR-associated endonuclease Cas1 [uncultured archaeon]